MGLPTVLRQLNPKIVVGAVYVSALFMTILDATIVTVALPRMAAEFGVRALDGRAVIIGYLLSLAVFMPASGWFGDRWGSKRVFLAALGIFVGASTLCGLAASLPQLVAFRIVQGVGGGLLTPVGLAMMLRTFAPAERVRASRILTIPTTVAPATGPVLGGLLTDQLSWRWAFFVNIPIGLLALAFGALALVEWVEPTAGRFDIAGFLLSGAGLGSVMYALNEGPTRGWTAPDALAAGITGIVLLAVLVVVELRVAEPILRLRLLGARLFRSNVVVIFLGTAAFLGTLYLMPLFLQNGRGASPLVSGLTTFPEAVGVLCSAQVVARIYPRVGPRRLQVIGLIGISVAMATMGFVGTVTAQWLIALLMFAMGICMGMVFLPTQTAAFAATSTTALGRAAALFNSMRQLGSAVGVALLSMIVSIVGSTGPGVDAAGLGLAAYHAGFVAAAVVALTGAAMALTVRDGDAASTMRPVAADKQPLIEVG
ncbi:MAG: DHA2 family efflux MFS transporter permease subunit [Kutzneria sp.]|nr:DHA2 family efflux MFS transporter permease subunit [Kutzneria sp.]